MRPWVYTTDEELRCPNPKCGCGWQPREANHGEKPGLYCVDCGVPRDAWPDDLEYIDEGPVTAPVARS